MEVTEEKGSKTITTLHFGEITVEPQHIFVFPNGLLGFEELREFVLISVDETVPFKWLISLEMPEIGFPLLSPWHIDLTYEPGRFFNSDKNVIFVIITLTDDKGMMTANMKAPLILDVIDQTGEQIILPSDRYSTNYSLNKKNSSK